MAELDRYLVEQRERFEDELCELLRIASVSTDGQHAAEIRQAGEWVAAQLRGLGLATELIDTSGNPVVYAQSAPVAGAPVVLVYGHYDVQPPDPLGEWISPPFEPTRRNGNLYARGATDDKGQMLTHIKSAEAWIRTVGRLPVQLKFLIEGEEEVGSRGVTDLIGQEAERLACDVVVISDSCQFGPGQPAITYGLKGLAYFELRLTGPRQDLHSGTFGGAVTNPANGLTRMLASLINDVGRVQVPGFYDDVVPLSDRERQQFASLPFDESVFMQRLGVQGLAGEQGYTTLERRWARPTFDINGIWGGYQGAGSKTVLPARAGAKFSFRLVPDQDPDKIRRALREHLEPLCPPGIQMELIDMHGARGIVVPLDSPFMQAAATAIEQGFGRPPVFIREGGSIPIVNVFHELLGVDTLLLGWGQDDDNTHSPNEKFSLADFHRGIRTSAHLWHALGKIEVEQRA
ncbi:MAG: dipeptidase [Pirellulaceae bacterium]|jgi:succinyl-diaminopimelate desuccinylase|nr:dipeptidase [Pirellulaceae bacterium]